MSEIRLAHEDENGQIAQILGQAFNRGRRYFEPIIEKCPPDDLWVAAEGGRVIGTIRARLTKQFFWGRLVPVVMIRAVAMAAHARGRGLLKPMLRSVLEQHRHLGAGIAIITPSSVSAYQRAGFDLAGLWPIHIAPIESVPVSRDTTRLEPFGPEAFEAVAECHRRFAANHNGTIERSEDWWKETNLYPTGDDDRYRYLARESGTVTGYVIYTQRPVAGRGVHHTLCFADLVWTDLNSMRAIVSFIAGHRALADGIEWSGPPTDPLLSIFGRSELLAGANHTWLARSVDPMIALRERGYPTAVSAEVNFTIEEPLLDGGPVALSVCVEGGHAEVMRLDNAALTMDPGTFGAIFTGWLDPKSAFSLGRLPGGTEREANLLSEIFTGPVPWSMELI